MESKEYKHIKRFYDCLSRTSSVCLADRSNPFSRLRSEDRHKIIAAFVASSEFNYKFEMLGLPLLERVFELYNEYGDTPPEVLHLEGNSYGADFTGTQYADFNTRTLELVYTHYRVHPSCMFCPCKGKGQIPVDEDWNFSFENYVPMD